MKKQFEKNTNDKTIVDNSINISNSEIKKSQIGHNFTKQGILIGVITAVIAGIILSLLKFVFKVF